MKTLRDWLLYLTNNESKPKSQWLKDEIFFDILFFIFGSILLIIGLIGIVLYIITKQDLYLGLMFGCEFIICYIWLVETIRHNR